MTRKLRIVFMGTPSFAVECLKTLHSSQHQVVAVVTVPDKHSGRGLDVHPSEVKKAALAYSIPVLQPEKLKDEHFLKQLADYKSDLFVVVAFRMLPEQVWTMPPLGTINLHASLLPDYRGAAPINWAVINGDSKTGVTTFFIEKEIDTGKIIKQKEITIAYSDNAGIVHDKLMFLGSNLLLETVNEIADGTVTPIDQSTLITTNRQPKIAPKIFSQNCKINWESNAEDIYNFVRGLSPYPGAWCNVRNTKTQNDLMLKVFETQMINETHHLPVGKIISDNKSYMHITCQNGYISLVNLQLSGKKRLDIVEFLKGNKPENLEII